MRPHVAFVVDAGLHVGMGHLSRCTVLADALASEGSDCAFFVTHASGIRESGFDTALLDRNANALPGSPFDAIVVDGYCFEDPEFDRWRTQAGVLVWVDDFATTPRQATCVLNHNAYAQTLDYAAYEGSELLLGPEFALIRKGFRELRGMAGESGRVLVTLGGGATALAALDLAPALAQAGARRIDLAMGSMHADVPNVPGCDVVLHRNADMVALLAKADVFISGLGVTYLEALAANRKFIGIQVADNQALNVAHARAHGLAALTEVDAAAIAECFARVSGGPDPDPSPFPDSGGPSRVARHILDAVRERA